MPRSDVIYKKGQLGRELYMVIHGTVEILLEDEEHEQVHTTLACERSGYFGDACVQELFRPKHDDRIYCREQVCTVSFMWCVSHMCVVSFDVCRVCGVCRMCVVSCVCRVMCDV